MNKEAKYFAKPADGQARDEEKCMRATAFFANAFNRSSQEDLNGLDFFGLPSQCREISIMAIQELLDFYDCSAKVAEKAMEDDAWQLERSYENISTQQEWVALDRQ